MDDNKYIAGSISAQLAAGSPLVLVSIIESRGSSPRHSGTKMVVAADGAGYGTIGGGILEATAIARSGPIIQAKQSRLMSFNFNGTGPESDAMLCGGSSVLLFDFIAPTPENVELFRQHHDSVSRGEDFYFFTVLRHEGESVEVLGHSLLWPEGKLSSTYSWPQADVETVRSELHGISSTTVLSLADTEVVVDPIRKTRTLYCFGAGHVGMATARLAAIVGFRVVAVDDRAEFASRERFPDADEVLVIDDFSRALDGLPIDRDSFIVIVTRGHKHDRAVLEQALKTSAGYIGMIGSRRKRDTVYSALLARGVSPEQLQRVHSPIGVAIHAETPEEIGVSIVAEMIAAKAKQPG